MFKKVIVINKMKKRQVESKTVAPDDEQIDVSFLVQQDPLLKDLGQRHAPERKPDPTPPEQEEKEDTLQYLDQLFDQALRLEEEKQQALSGNAKESGDDSEVSVPESDSASALTDAAAPIEAADGETVTEVTVTTVVEEIFVSDGTETAVIENAEAAKDTEAAAVTEVKEAEVSEAAAATEVKEAEVSEAAAVTEEAPATEVTEVTETAGSKAGTTVKRTTTTKTTTVKKPAAKKDDEPKSLAKKAGTTVKKKTTTTKTTTVKKAAKKNEDEIPEDLLVTPIESDPEEESFRGEEVIDIDYGDEDDEDEERLDQPAPGKPAPKKKTASKKTAAPKEATFESIAEVSAKKPASKKKTTEQDISFGTSKTGKATIEVPKIPKTPPAPKKKTSSESGSGLKFLFQPILEPAKGRLWGFECLLRIFDVELGELKPSIFLDVAQKDLRLIKRLELWSMEEVFLTSRRMADKDLGMLSVNISTKHLLDPTFIPNTLKIISNVGVKQDNVYFEFKQEILTNFDTFEVFEKLEALREAGVKTCIDDFNAEYFKGNMKDVPPIDMLKFDRALTRTFLSTPESKSAIRTIIAFAKANKMEVVGVGVETKEHEEGLLKLGIKKMQGYFYSKPMRSQRMVIKKK